MVRRIDIVQHVVKPHHFLFRERAVLMELSVDNSWHGKVVYFFPSPAKP